MAKFPQIEKEVIADANALLIEDAARHSDEKSLLLARQRGPFLRLCPGTQKHLCCLYYNLDVAAGCDLECSYCILQGYLTSPLITIYCNMDDMYGELGKRLARSRSFHRIGTGELSDSLTFEPVTELGAELVVFFADKKNAIIELKSKNVHIESLLGLAHNRRSVISWSMNTEAMQACEEGFAATIEDRLLAAAEVQRAGYRIGFHFDPMLDHPGWQEGYRDVVDKIFRRIRPENIVWISLGALRYPAAFDTMLRTRHPRSKIYLGELLPGMDGKLRYFKPIRIEMFRKMHDWIRSYSRDVFIYLCMESRDVWQKSFGWAPRSNAELKRLLDDQVRE
ncbi:DNA photolyase [candidate division KSB1 bacterium]|nr:DNA photolyase [candidate division KSB1 bacterium]RQW09989.1 MAG: DNA photolyase [candidate division KSB1 bacterium]